MVLGSFRKALASIGDPCCYRQPERPVPFLSFPASFGRSRIATNRDSRSRTHEFRVILVQGLSEAIHATVSESGFIAFGRRRHQLRRASLAPRRAAKKVVEKFWNFGIIRDMTLVA